MTKRLPCPAAPGPLEDYAAQFDPLFARLAQRRGFRAYLQGLLLPRDRNKTLTALTGTEPVVGAQHRAVQGLQWFVSEAPWDAGRMNRRRVQLLVADPATGPRDHGVLVLDDSGDRKAGRHTRPRGPPVPGLALLHLAISALGVLHLGGRAPHIASRIGLFESFSRPFSWKQPPH
jgi:hypothetical protein